MYLHEDKEMFTSFIQVTASTYHLDEAFVEKDYYVCLLLDKLRKKLPTLLFKGGTSLVKCYHIINRFSEDIDISLAQEKISERPRKRVKEAIKEACLELGLVITNLNNTESDRDYNHYEIDYHPLYTSGSLKAHLSIETVYMVKNYSYEEKYVSSFIGDYISTRGDKDLLTKLNLSPFPITVQSLSRTIVDKIFALCDYYLEDKIARNSRHIYDIYMLLKKVPLNKDFHDLFIEVRKDRRASKSRCLSAEPEYDISLLLEEIIDREIFKSDYNEITSKIIYDDVNYEIAISGLKKILISHVLMD